MPCNPCAAATLLPTMSPFMRAGMKCEALGINSATELPALQWPCASEQCLDGHRSQGGHTRCSLGVQLFVHLSPLWLAGLSSPARQDTLGGLAPASLCLRNHPPNPGVPAHCHTPQERHQHHTQREKAILHPAQQSLPKPPAVALRIPQGMCGRKAQGLAGPQGLHRAAEPCQLRGACLSRRSCLAPCLGWQPAPAMDGWQEELLRFMSWPRPCSSPHETLCQAHNGSCVI